VRRNFAHQEESMIADLTARADRLRDLHHVGEMLVLPNVWDAASAKIVAEAGFPVIATASAAISAMLGYLDAEGAPSQELFAAAGRVSRGMTGADSAESSGRESIPRHNMSKSR